jgi:hypothetical protein
MFCIHTSSNIADVGEPMASPSICNTPVQIENILFITVFSMYIVLFWILSLILELILSILVIMFVLSIFGVLVYIFLCQMSTFSYLY